TIEEFLLLHEALDQKAVSPEDAALGIATRHAEILATRPTGRAIRIRAGASDGWHDEIAGRQLPHRGPHLLDDPNRLVPENQVGLARGWKAEMEGAEFTIRSANAYLERADEHLARRGDQRLGVVDQRDLATL